MRIVINHNYQPKEIIPLRIISDKSILAVNCIDSASDNSVANKRARVTWRIINTRTSHTRAHLAQFLVSCTLKLDLGTYARVLYDWDGNEIRNLDAGEAATYGVHCTLYIVLGASCINANERSYLYIFWVVLVFLMFILFIFYTMIFDHSSSPSRVQLFDLIHN